MAWKSPHLLMPTKKIPASKRKPGTANSSILLVPEKLATL